MSQFNDANSGTTVSFWRTTGFVIFCGCLVTILAFGLRSTFGLFTQPITNAHGWGREVFALALAIQNLIWGIGQPIAGAIADRYGPVKVLVIGSLFYGAGIALIAYSSSPLSLNLTAGLLVGLGLSGTAFGIVISAFGKMVPEEKRSWAMGLATASGSLGQFLFAPLGQAFITGYGWQTALLLLAAFTLFMPMLATAFKASNMTHLVTNERQIPFRQAMKYAFGHKSYLLLIAGFFVCGFHVAFIAVHFPAYLSDLGMPSYLGAWSIAVIGLFNIAGSYTAGVLGGKNSKRKLLSALYFSRSIVIAVFIMSPPSPFVILVFSATMGLLWLSTVPLTSGLVAAMFGTQYLATLFGVVFFSHQIGSFLGIWLGGVTYDLYGSYDIVWWISIALGIFSGLVHLPIKEDRAEAFQPSSA